ncbi:hypothetical protein PPYR_12255 [Photinus pyralis]|uniref:Uncharacterized protein n=3 Tax=Photinus pyralis TaxID=7054 RepID=A0A5N4ADM1_PHOPY|nr:uncharacterized protein LOC116177114 [Photinus pyralis]KAB0795416.1 hypothetical protein PPYR_12255 [Photinus pyralis]
MFNMCSNFYLPKDYVEVGSTRDEEIDEVEVHTITLLFLRFLLNQDIENFWCCTKVRGFGLFKDLVIGVHTKSGSTFNYAIHFPSRGNPEGLQLKQLLSTSNQDVFNKYTHDIEDFILNEEPEENLEITRQFKDNSLAAFVLYYPWNVEESLEVAPERSQDENCFGILQTSVEGSFLFDTENSHSNFFLWVNQQNVSELKDEIRQCINILTKHMGLEDEIQEHLLLAVTRMLNEIGLSFDKHYILNVMHGVFLQPYVWNFDISGTLENNVNLKGWSSVLKKSRIAVVKDNTIQQCLKDYLNALVIDFRNSIKNLSLDFRENEDLSLNDVYEIMWQSGKAPLVIDANSLSVHHYLIRLLHNCNSSMKTIFLINRDWMSSLEPDMCTKLKDFDEDVVIEVMACPITLQGRPTTLSKTCVELYTELINLFEVGDIISILSGQYNIGNMPQPLLTNHIEASVDEIWIDTKALKEITTDYFIIRYDYRDFDDLKTFFKHHQIDINDDEFSNWNENTNNSITRINLITHDSTAAHIHSCLIQYETTHFLKFSANLGLEWLYSFDTNKNLLKYVTKNGYMNHQRIKMVQKKFEWHILGSEIRIIDGIMGSGKTILLDYLENTIKTKWWIMRIDLKTYAPRKMYAESTMNAVSKLVFNYYMKKGNIVVLIDGFDELKIELFEEILKEIRRFSRRKYVTYITTRPNYKIFLEESLHTFSVSIHGFGYMKQRQYLNNYFTSKSSSPTECTNLLSSTERKSPLHLKILADFISVNGNTVDDKETDVVALCKYFVDSYRVLASNDNLGHQQADYEYCRYLYACKETFSLGDRFIPDLSAQINRIQTENANILKILKEDQILKVTNDNNANFVHRLFAEYVIARWLSEHFENNPLIQSLFDARYSSIRKILDQILASDCPLHLAVINQQYSLAEEIISLNSDAIHKLDLGGRSVLHLIGYWDNQCKNVLNYAESEYDDEEASFNDVHNPAKVSSRLAIINIIRRIPSTSNSTYDQLLGYSELDYALSNESFFVANELLTKFRAVNLTLEQNQIQKYKIQLEYSEAFLVCYIFGKVKLNTRHPLFLGIPTFSEVFNIILRCDQETIILFEELLQKKSRSILAKISQKTDSHKRNILHYSACKGLVNLSKMLCEEKDTVIAKDRNEWTPLHFASYYGHLDVVDLLLSTTKENVNYVEKKGRTPLMLAAEKGYTEVLELLLQNEADVNAVDVSNMSALCYAIMGHHKNGTEILLNHGAHTEHRTESGRTPLLLASSLGRLELVQLLDNYKCNKSVADNHRQTSLFIAANEGHLEVARYLLEKGANLEVVNTEGFSTLSAAIFRGHTEIVKLLMENGGNVNAVGHFNWTPLALATYLNNLDLVTILLSHPNIDIQGSSRWIPLYLAVHQNNNEIVNLLVNKGALVNVTSINYNRSALFVAVQEGQLEIVNVLIKNDADIHLPDKFRKTPLSEAIRLGNQKILKLLLDKTDFSSLSSDYNHFLLCETGKSNNCEVAEMLLSMGVALEAENGASPLIFAASYGQNAVMKFFLRRGADVNIMDKMQRTPLYWAASRGYLLTVKVLLNHGADVNYSTKNGSALFAAVQNEHTDIVRLLLQQGADVKITNHLDFTALSLAACQDNIEILKLLLHYNSDIEHKSKYGLTPLLHAAKKGQTEIAKILLDKGAFINVKDHQGRTPICHAVYEGHMETVKLFVNKKCDLSQRCDNGFDLLRVAEYKQHMIIYHYLRDIKQKREADSERRGSRRETNWRLGNKTEDSATSSIWMNWRERK